jgi:ribonuclease R
MSHDPRPQHTEETEREAAAIITRLPKALQSRTVVRGITIDSPTSKDLDDAFWLERDVGGGYRLAISIADVGSFVTTETQALDRAAQQRAFTRYLAEHQVPMLPRFLSEDALSLLPEQVRPAITLSIPLDERLHPEAPSILPTVVCSERRFSSEEVDRELTQPHTAFAPMLQEAVHLATALLERRRATGALAFYDLHQGWATTEEGLLFRLHERERHQGHILIQEETWSNDA